MVLTFLLDLCNKKRSGRTKMAAPQNTQHVSEFSPDGKLFAFINAEGKLKIWDSESNQLKQEYIPNLHLSAPCTCFTWITVTTSATNGHVSAAAAAATTHKSCNFVKYSSTQGAKSKKSRKSLDRAETTLYIALGTSKGGVVLYSYATGKVNIPKYPVFRFL